MAFSPAFIQSVDDFMTRHLTKQTLLSVDILSLNVEIIE